MTKDNVTNIDGGTRPPDHNGIDNDALKGFVDREENLQSAIDKIMDKARLDCQKPRDDIKLVRNEASDEGFTKKTFAAVITHRKLLRKAEDADRKLNEDQKDSYVQMLHALGDLAGTPLGDSAMT